MQQQLISTTTPLYIESKINALSSSNNEKFIDMPALMDNNEINSFNYEIQTTNPLKTKVLQLELDSRKLLHELNQLKENEIKYKNDILNKDDEIEKLNKKLNDLNKKFENINAKNDLNDENFKLKELSLQLIKLRDDEKQLRKLKLDEENELISKLKENEQELMIKLKQIEFENANLHKIEESFQNEIKQLKSDYEKCFNENNTNSLKCVEFESELKKQQKLNDNLKQELCDNIKQKELIESQLKESKIEILKLKQQLHNTTISLNESLSKIKLLADECKQEQLLRKQLVQLESEIDLLNKKQDKLKLDYDKQCDYIKKLEMENSNYNNQMKVRFFLLSI